MIGAGAVYFKTGRLDFASHDYPPLVKYLAGGGSLLAQPQKLGSPRFIDQNRHYALGHEFLYRNSVSPETLLTLARLPSLLLSLTTAFLVFLWARRWWGPWGGLLALSLYVFEPNLIAHGGLATTDMPLTAFLFAATFFVVRYTETHDQRDLVWSGLAAGAALASKTPAVLFFLWSPLLLGGGTDPSKKMPPREWLKSCLALGVLSASVLLVVYQGRWIGLFVDLFRNSVQLGFQGGWANYFHGVTQREGFWFYYLGALLIKTPLPFLALIALGATLAPDRRRTTLLVLPVAVWLVFFSFSSKQNGLRYCLPAFPFLCLLAGGLATAPLAQKIRPALLALFLWLPVETLSIAPHYLAYFNQSVGGPAQGHRWLVDSNLDWGQDLPALQRLWEKADRPALFLATAGIADRAHYFGPQQDVTLDINTPPWLYFQYHHPVNVPREWLVVSAGNLHGWGLESAPFAWLSHRTPLAQPGYSSFVYDITRDPESHFQLGIHYQQLGQYPFALRQFQRTQNLAPENPLPRLAEADALALMGRIAEARALFLEIEKTALDAAVRSAAQKRLQSLPKIR